MMKYGHTVDDSKDYHDDDHDDGDDDDQDHGGSGDCEINDYEKQFSNLSERIACECRNRNVINIYTQNLSRWQMTVII